MSHIMSLNEPNAHKNKTEAPVAYFRLLEANLRPEREPIRVSGNKPETHGSEFEAHGIKISGCWEQI